jgi:hypothetical protein
VAAEQGQFRRVTANWTIHSRNIKVSGIARTFGSRHCLYGCTRGSGCKKGLIRLTVLEKLLLHTGRRGTGIKEMNTLPRQYLFYAGVRGRVDIMIKISTA